MSEITLGAGEFSFTPKHAYLEKGHCLDANATRSACMEKRKGGSTASYQMARIPLFSQGDTMTLIVEILCKGLVHGT